MGVVYQLTFFVALGLLAIVITIFVFAVSLLGRAMEAAARSEKEKVAERKANNAEEMAAIKEEIERAEASGEIPKGLTRKLDKLEKRDKKYEKELSTIRKAPESLTVRSGIVPCGVLLLAALVLTGLAWYLSTIENLIWMIHVFIWILGLVAIGYTVSRIYQCLRVIESVAITSEEAAERRLAAAVRVALRDIEEEKKPTLQLIFRDRKPPFRIKADSEKTIEFHLKLTRGDEAVESEVYFIAPPGFDFTDAHTYIQKAGVHRSYITTNVEVGTVRSGVITPQEITLKAPSKVDEYTLFYRIVCKGFDSKPIEYKVVVE